MILTEIADLVVLKRKKRERKEKKEKRQERKIFECAGSAPCHTFL